MQRKRAALCLRGAVAKRSGHFYLVGDLYNDTTPYIKYTSVYKCIMKHIVDANPEYDIDIFIHCWNKDLQDDIVSLYKPVKYLFEDNNIYAEEIQSHCVDPKDFGGISHSLSIRKVLEMQEEYSKENSVAYDLIVLFRPDVLLWKDMPFSNYDLNYFYVDGHVDYNGDTFFIMSSQDAILFKDLYLSLNYGNRHYTHFWIKLFIIKYCNLSIKSDTIMPGKHYEVLRKIHDILADGRITYDKLKEYDIYPEDI